MHEHGFPGQRKERDEGEARILIRSPLSFSSRLSSFLLLFLKYRWNVVFFFILRKFACMRVVVLAL